MAGLQERGWHRFAFDPALRDWADAALPAAQRAVADKRHAQWLRCGGTWFAGVNVLANDTAGRIVDFQGDSGAEGPPLAGHAVDGARALAGGSVAWDKGQMSVVYPGYPLQQDESDAAFRFRRDRDAAHVDGLTRRGVPPRRFLEEPHAFVLGIALTRTDERASPLVVWDGSHHIMRRAFGKALRDVEPRDWHRVDLTEVYQQARRDCFATCPRIALHINPGEATLIHRLSLHGVSPWQAGAKAPAQGRMIAYFRPVLKNPAVWLRP